MFELTFSFYIKHDAGFYDWVRKQDATKISESVPQGIRFIGLYKPVFGDVGRLQARFQIDDMSATGKLHEASMKPGFFNELQSFMDNARVVETILVKKLL